MRRMLVQLGADHKFRSFSDGKPVESVETEKSRIVLQEVEKGWWILAVGGGAA